MRTSEAGSGVSAARLKPLVLVVVALGGLLGCGASAPHLPAHVPPAAPAVTPSPGAPLDGGPAFSAAKNAVRAVYSADYHALDGHDAEVLALSTGLFKRQYLAGQQTRRRNLTDGRITEVGFSSDPALVRLTPTEAEFLLTAQQSISTAAAAAPQLRDLRLLLDLELVDGHWLISSLNAVVRPTNTCAGDPGDPDRSRLVAQACHAATVLLTVDPDQRDAQRSAVRDVTTAPLQESWLKGLDSAGAGVAAHPLVFGAGVLLQNAQYSNVLVLVDETNANPQTGTKVIKRSLVLEMHDVRGRWLAAGITDA